MVKMRYPAGFWICMSTVSSSILTVVNASASPFTAAGGPQDPAPTSLSPSRNLHSISTTATSEFTDPNGSTALSASLSTPRKPDTPNIALPIATPPLQSEDSDAEFTISSLEESPTTTPKPSPHPVGLTLGHGPVVTNGAVEPSADSPSGATTRYILVTTGGDGTAATVTSFIPMGETTTSVPKSTLFLTVNGIASMTRSTTTITPAWLTSKTTTTPSISPGLVQNRAIGHAGPNGLGPSLACAIFVCLAHMLYR